MTDTQDADRRIDELFVLPPEQFTAARNTLVRELRGADQRELAATVSKLRRPTVAAWAVNQTVRGHRQQFEALLDAGDQVRRAQRRALSGVRPGDMRDATKARRAHIEQLAGFATDFLTERGVAADSHHGDIVATFDAASADADIATAVGAARLSQALPVSPGFGALAGLTVFAGAQPDDGDPSDAGTEPPEAEDDSSVDDGRADDRREQEALARRAAMRAVEEVRRRLTEAEAVATRAAAEVTRADARAAAADQTADVAEDRARRLRSEADELQARAERATARATQALQEAEELRTRLHDREQQLQALDG